MKKTSIISFFIMFMVMMSIAAIAQEVEETGKDYIGNPTQNDIPRGGAFTIVNDAVCSTNADFAKSGAVSGSSLCWNNANGGSPGGNGIEHLGVVYQVFTANSNGLAISKIGEVSLSAGDRKCVSVQDGNNYYRQAFYCDDAQNKCEETFPYYTAGCDIDKCGEGKVLRVRGLNDVVANGCSQEGWQSEVCIKDSDFGFTCDKATKTESTSGGNDGADGNPSSSNLKGEWQNIGIPSNVEPRKQFIINARFKALADGKYYLEAGMLPDVFSITAEGSKCDGSKEFAGEYVDLKTGDDVDITFKPIASEKIGRHSVVLGAYSGCLSDGGEKINVISKAVKVGDADSNFGLLKLAIGGLGFGIILALLLIIAGGFLFFKK